MPIYTPDQVLAMGKPSTKAAPKGKVLSIADVEKMQPTQPKAPSASQKWEAAKSDVTNFLTQAAKEYNDAEQAGFRHPVDYTWGMAKGILSGIVGLTNSSVEGLSGGAKALMGMSEKDAGKNFKEGMKAGDALIKKITDHVPDVPGVTDKSLKPSDKIQEAAAHALGIIPQAIQAAGDTGFDLTNSPIVGATTQAVGTLVSLLGLKGLKSPLEAMRKPVEKPAEVPPAEQPPEEPPAAAAPKEIVPPPKPAVKTKPSEPSLDELTAQLWQAVGEQKESLSQPKTEANASGESSASLEAQSRVREEESHGRLRFQIDPDGNVTPLRGVDSVDAKAPQGHVIVQAGVGTDPFTVLDRGGLPQAHAKGLLARARQNLEGRMRELATEGKGKTAPTKAKTQAKSETVRYYHGGEATGHGPLWMTSSLEDAKGWAKNEGSSKIWYVDVPKNHPARGGDIANGIAIPTRIELPAELATKRKLLGGTPKPDPVMFQENGQLVRRSTVQHAFDIIQKGVDAIPGSRVVQGKIRQYIEEIQRHIVPESLGPEAKAAAAILAKNMAESQMKEANFQTKSAPRRAFWNSRMDNAQEFIRRYEKGGKFEDPMLQEAAEAYRAWNSKIASQDAVNHIEYEPVDNYLYHTFQDGDRVAEFLGQRYRAKWGDPGFTKDRVFDLYDQAIKAGYKPRFTNPEDIMLARQHASDIAHMKIQALRDLADAGLAVQIRKGMKAAPDGFTPGEFRAPNGERYWVSKNAAQILHNAWNTISLWQARGIAGDAFRGAMFLKNTLVPFKLGFSLFHPLHVATIDNATGMVRASKELLSGRTDPVTWFKHMIKSAAYLDSIHQTRSGYRLMKLWQGRVPEGELTDADRQSLQWMAEGGFVPEMPIQYRTGALAKFRDAVQRHSLTAAWHAPFAALDAMQKPLFQVWIPSLKTASFLADAKSAIAADPTLLDNPLKRQVAFRKLAKSVDNRYGEMAYSTLFWNRMIKDIAVANTLSLGWQLGFLREYGGAASDLGSSLLNKGKLSAKARAGLLDRPLFALFYTTQALTYGGLLTWAMTGKPPTQILDYVYPRVGTDQEGKAKRVSTMFYPREFWAIAKHVQNQGALGGLQDLVRSKSSGVMGLLGEWATGVNGLGQQIRDPNAPPFKKLEQTLSNSLSEFEPISIEATHRQGKEMLSKEGVMNTAGFTPAPRYITETPAQSYIQRIYDQSYQGKETPYEQVERSKDTRALRQAYADADQGKFNDLLDKMRSKYKLSANEEQRLIQSLDEPPSSAYIKMFKRLKWQDQKRALDKMTQDERDIFLPVANVDHLRYTYTPPEDQQ